MGSAMLNTLYPGLMPARFLTALMLKYNKPLKNKLLPL
jgi:hypothetical protein